MSRVYPAWFDFIGRATFGGDNGFARDKRLLALGLILGLGAAIFDVEWMMWGLFALIIGVFVADVRRYNREQSDG